MPNWLTRERLLVIGVFVVLLFLSRKATHLGWSSFWYFVVLIPSIVLHEISHGWLANRFGDPTAKLAGRLTLNPIKHIDPVGTIILPGLLIIGGLPAFGYAKPVPVNVTHMSRNQAMFTGLVGPFTNVILSLIGVGLLVGGYHARIPYGVAEVIITFGIVNVVLAVFNMIPIPPLDGSSLIERFLPARYMRGYLQFRQYSMILLFIIVLAGQNVIGGIFDPFTNAWYSLANTLLPN